MNLLPGISLVPASAPGHRAVVPPGQGGLGETPSYRALAPAGADGSPTIVHCSFYIVHCWTYTFSAKEKDAETGLSYFGSRYYSSDLSIWLSVDPQSDKYASLSPYVYCADNPVKLVDPNGEEIWIDFSLDEKGNKVVNIHFTATLNNKTGKEISDKEMENYKNDISKGIRRVYGRKFDDGTTVNVNVDINIHTEGDLEDPSSTRHQINIVNKFTEEHAGESPIGGEFMEFRLDVCEGRTNSLRRTAAHEFGHLLGLDHVTDADNIMNEKTDGEIITAGQIYEACYNYNTGRINKNIKSIEFRNEHRRKASVIYQKYRFQ
jgi:RHS repeat-associated protein